MCSHNQAARHVHTLEREREGELHCPLPRPQCHSHSHSQAGQATDKLHLQLQFAVCIAAGCGCPPLSFPFLFPLTLFAPPRLHCPVSLAAPFYHCVRLRGLFARVNIKFEPQPNEPSRVEPPTTAAASAAATFFWPWAWQGG